MPAFEIGEFIVGQKPGCVRRPRGRCRRAGGRPPVYGLIIPKMLCKQFLGKVLKGSRIEPCDSVPDFNFSAHQSCSFPRFLRHSKRPRLKTALNHHGKLDDMTYAALARTRLPIAKQFRLRLTRRPFLRTSRDIRVCSFAHQLQMHAYSVATCPTTPITFL